MAKLDLSALKKQKLMSGPSLAAPAASAAPSIVESVVPAVSVAVAVPPVSEIIPTPAPVLTASIPVPQASLEPAIMKAFENPHKPKLSLSHFKKADSTSSVAAPVVAISTPTPAQVVVSPVFSAPEPVVMVDVPVVSMIQEVASVVDVAVELPEVVEPSTPIEAKIEPTPVTVETPAAATGSEFFPNLEFENDNLFDDFVKMGTFENEKSEISLLPVEVTLEPVVIEMSEIVATPESTEVPEVSVTTVVPVGELAELVVLEEIPSATVTEWVVTQDSEGGHHTENVLESMQAIAEQSNKEVKAEEMKTETPVVATSAGVTPAYVEEVAADLSKDRKGWLSALFENKKKVFYGIGAFVFTSVMAIGGLATLGIIDFDGTTKASVMETPKIVAVNTSPVVSPTKNTPEIIPPVLTASGVTTQTGASTSTGQTFYPPIVVTSSGTSMVVGGTGSLIVPPKWTGSIMVATGAVISGSGAWIPPKGTGSVVVPPKGTGSVVVPPKGTGSLVTPPKWTGSVVVPPKGTTQTGSTTPIVTSSQTGSVVSAPPASTSVNTYRVPNNKTKKRN